MEILKQGNPERTPKIVTTARFTCTNCGCEFTADFHEFTDFWKSNYVEAKCPNCNSFVQTLLTESAVKL